MARSLVTGGAGFIGSHLVDELLRRGDDVVVLDDLSGSTDEWVAPGALLVTGSVADERLIGSLFTEHRFDRVFHFAAFTAEVVSGAVKRHNYETNVLGSVILINAAVRAGVQYFSFASTVGVYGHGRVPMRESDQPAPADSYAIGKLTVERELEITMRDQGLPYTAWRLHNVYGERQNMCDPYRNAVAIFINQILRGDPITLYGTGEQVRAFTYVHDIVPAIAAAAERPAAWGHSLNIGSSVTCSVRDLVEHIRSAMGAPGHEVLHLPARSEVDVAYPDNARARDVVGPWPETRLADGLERTAAWARERGPAELSASFELELADAQLPEWVCEVRSRVGRKSADVQYVLGLPPQ
jgi:UDP-glucose 4-epimerase